MGMDDDMDGDTMSQAEMLETATADEATRPFLTGMIKHHQGASPWPKPSSPMARTPRPSSSPKPAAARPLLPALCWGVPDRDGRGEEHRRNRHFSPAERFKT
jgi:hypothetical protein